MVPEGGVAEVWLDIGINLSPQIPHGRKWADLTAKRAVYLGFEALLDKYAVHISSDVKANEFRPVGTMGVAKNFGIERARIFPFAVTDMGSSGQGLLDFHALPVDGASSLNEPRSKDELQKGWAGKQSSAWLTQVSSVGEVRSVPHISLHEVLTQWLRNILAGKEAGDVSDSNNIESERPADNKVQVAYLHLDVQGAEMQVIKSAKDEIRRIQRIQLEVPLPNCPTLTRIPYTCDDYFEQMVSLGYRPAATHWYDVGLKDLSLLLKAPEKFKDNLEKVRCSDINWPSKECEYDVIFVRNGVPAILPP